ncbi:MAG TPA: MBL fold metallo-hydrolase [Syntrophales bacterium]|nr:MBL fold metallo-hydrolase [Syntrophales bacterium]
MCPQLDERLRVLGHPYFHIYLIRGKERSALVEMGISATADIVIGQLSSIGVRPDYLIITHPHSDHVAGLDAMREAFPLAVVIAARGAAAFLDHPKTAQSLVEEDHYMSSFMAEHGFPGRRSPISRAPSLSGCMVMTSNDTLDLGDVVVHFLNARGHSPGNLIIHVPALRAVLASDNLGYWVSGAGFFPIFFTGFTDYLATIDVIESLDPQFLGLAHNVVAAGADVRKTLDDARGAAVHIMERIRNDRREDELVAEELAREYHRDELALYSRENILSCCRLIVRRVRELLD